MGLNFMQALFHVDTETRLTQKRRNPITRRALQSSDGTLWQSIINLKPSILVTLDTLEAQGQDPGI